MDEPRGATTTWARWLLGDDDGTASNERWLRSPLVLVLVLVLVYLPSFGGSWLRYDDDWLVRDNVVLSRADPRGVLTILTAFDRDSRLALGAEYLPVRDLVVWLVRGVLGLDVGGLRLVLFALYATGIVAFLEWARRAPPTHARTLCLSTWLFAVHPVHVESAAWLAGFKDVLLLLFTGLALLAYESRAGRIGALVPLLVALGALSKAAGVVTPLLLLTTDLLARRRPRGRIVLPSLLVASVSAALHAWVGSVVGMYASPVADRPLPAVATMLVVFARYVGLALGLHPQSIVYEVEVHAFDVASVASAALWLCFALGARSALRRRDPVPAFALLWFFAALAPVSQLVAPLQNRMADRYALVALFGATTVLARVVEWLCGRASERLRDAIRLLPAVAFGALAAWRNLVFSDPVLLFAEATERTSRDPRPAYMLAESLVEAGDDVAAEAAYRIALERDDFRTDRGRRAGNNLARLLLRNGRVEEARELYRILVARFPNDPRVLHNLAVVEESLGNQETATAQRAELARRFPTYRPGAPEPPGPH